MFAPIRRLLAIAGLGHSPRTTKRRCLGAYSLRRRRLFLESLEDRAMLTVPDVLIDGAAVFEEGQEIAVTVFLSAPSEDTVAVDFTIGDMVANAVATPTVDYWLIGASPGVFSGTLVFAPETTEQTFYIGAVNDTHYEGKEWLSIQLSNPVNATLTDEYDEFAADVFIEDAEDPFIIISQTNEYLEPSTAEEPFYAIFTVELVGGMGANSTAVSWTTTVEDEDTATPGSDFQSVNGTVTVTSSDPFAEILVPLLYGDTCEGAETFHVALTGATNGISILLADGMATIRDGIEVPEEEPPPDCECGAEGARHVTGVTSDAGDEFWEGDEVTFTASLDSPTPQPNETFVWEWRPARLITRAGSTVYGPWQPFPGGGNSAAATHTFSEPFIGQVRVTLTSAGTISSKVIGIRAKAAFPVDFRVVSSGPGPSGVHLSVDYAWSSSSGRMDDLDFVEMGEFVWYTEKGKLSGQKGTPLTFRYPKPPFDNIDDDGFYVASNAISGVGHDIHGGVQLVRGAEKTQNVNQYYWFKLNDGFHYWQETEFDVYSSKIVGDPYGRQQFRTASISYIVQNTGSGWVLKIQKLSGGQYDGSIEIPIPGFPWP